jgi:hypothetical protein
MVRSRWVILSAVIGSRARSPAIRGSVAACRGTMFTLRKLNCTVLYHYSRYGLFIPLYTNPNCQSSGPSAHHRSSPAHGPPQVYPCITPRIPSYVRAQRLGYVHPRLPPPRRFAQSLGAPLQWPIPDPVKKGQDVATPRPRETRHRVH